MLLVYTRKLNMNTIILKCRELNYLFIMYYVQFYLQLDKNHI